MAAVMRHPSTEWPGLFISDAQHRQWCRAPPELFEGECVGHPGKRCV